MNPLFAILAFLHSGGKGSYVKENVCRSEDTRSNVKANNKSTKEGLLIQGELDNNGERKSSTRESVN